MTLTCQQLTLTHQQVWVELVALVEVHAVRRTALARFPCVLFRDTRRLSNSRVVVTVAALIWQDESRSGMERHHSGCLLKSMCCPSC